VLLSLVVDQVASRWVTESARDPLILAGVTSLLVAIAVVACLGSGPPRGSDRPDARAPPRLSVVSRNRRPSTDDCRPSTDD
jgi:hypothetical protein